MPPRRAHRCGRPPHCARRGARPLRRPRRRACPFIVHVAVRALHFLYTPNMSSALPTFPPTPHIVHKGVHDSRFAHAPRHVVVHLPGVVVHGSGFVLVAAMSLASAALPRMSHMAHVAVYALDLATRWASDSYSALHCASALHPAAAAPSCTNINRAETHIQNFITYRTLPDTIKRRKLASHLSSDWHTSAIRLAGRIFGSAQRTMAARAAAG
ncbi:hypothetical protein B0H14DRAFT_3904700 [Mycena olivaceomarginata]|nr:hypothetical protein B0H14DRAFT_3904700 [Mycena olivaceomarginata]